jgi:cellulase
MTRDPHLSAVFALSLHISHSTGFTAHQTTMKSSLLVTALAIQQISAHSIFQQLWVDGVDKAGTCVRLPSSNSPVTNVNSNDMRCNSGTRGVSGKCAVSAGGTVTVEMHAQPGDRSCKNEAIGGNHYGPVLVYMSKVADAGTADGSSGWYVRSLSQLICSDEILD